MGQPIADNAPPPIGKNDEDEWEYEYDATETEDLYFTLDLTTHVADALLQKPTPANTSPVRGSPRNGENEGQEGAVDEGEACIGNSEFEGVWRCLKTKHGKRS